MHKYLSTNEYWDKLQKLFHTKETRDIGELNIWHEYGDIKATYFNTGHGINYSSFYANLYEDTIMESLTPKDISFLYFNIGSNIKMNYKKVKNGDMNLRNNAFCNGKMYEGCSAKGLYSKKTPYHFHCLSFDNSTFQNLLNEFSQNTKHKSYENDYMQMSFNENLSLKQKSILLDLCNVDKYNGKLKEIYFESKLLELVYSTIEQLKLDPLEETIHLSSADVERIKKAKSILLEDIVNPPSLKELAYKSAINDFKLKKGFKKIYGNTVFGFLQEHRLEKAKKLIEKNEVNINEAARLVGYKSISHFSKIFKEHFGVLPISVKKENVKYYV